ncbi:MAG: glycosyltransferase family 2 protein [Thermoanaerobaculia bacterium]
MSLTGPVPGTPSVLAVVLNYNGRDITLQSVASLLASDYPALEILVVDNGSTDGSHEAVGTAFPQVGRLRTETNLGISGGLNLGIRSGLERGFDFLMLCNNDIEVAPDMVSRLVEAAGSEPRAGCLGPKCYYFYGDRRRIWSAGGELRWRESVTRERGMGEIDRGQYDADRETDYVNGACMLVRRAAMLETGLWDPVYQVSVEDADWCVRMRRAGWTARYVAAARLWHMVSPTTGGYTAARTFRTGRSTAIFVRKYAGPAGWLGFLLFSAVAFPAALLRELPRRNAAAVFAKYRGLAAGLRQELPPVPAVRT